MVSLQHLAVYKLTETQRYDGEDPVIEDVIFEADQIRNNLDDELVLHTCRKPQLKVSKFDLREYTRLMDTISYQLFDVFTYNDMISTSEHVTWKEYFQTLYEFVMVEGEGSHQLIASTLKYYEVIERPDMVGHRDPCFTVIHYIDQLFTSLRSEQESISKMCKMSEDYSSNVEYGMKMIEWTRELKAIHEKLDIYDRIVRWSMR